MSQNPSPAPVSPPLSDPPWTSDRARAWYWALIVSFLILAATGFLLARLIWLPFYFGLFFFLVAGLLAGALSFRMARSARPIPQSRIARGVVFVALAATAVTLVWEYEHVATTIDTQGIQVKFADARTAAVKAGRPPSGIAHQARDVFKSALRTAYPPGGSIGYARWAVKAGEMELVVEGCKDTVSISQRGYAWLTRTLAGALLLAAGLWASFESLRSSRPVSNILAPGEEYEEE